MYSDTDNFVYEIGEDFYEIMHKHKEMFDISNQPKNSKYDCHKNKKVAGKMKDEDGGTTIYEFIGLKSKMYSICDVKCNEKSTLNIIHILVILNIIMYYNIKRLLDIN